jgi:riboflavin synthase
MFTGIIIAMGRLESLQPKGGDVELEVEASTVESSRLAIGDSISVEGACLTVTRRAGARFFADVSRETLSKTTLGGLKVGSRVNLEPALRAGDALGGHLVSGHVDGLGRVTEMVEDARSVRIEFEVPPELKRFIAAKGSVCINGVSLTVNGVDDARFDVNIIPHTREVTTLGALKVGSAVNIEIDLIARYLERLNSA